METAPAALALDGYPEMFVLARNISTDERHSVEQQLGDLGATVTSDIQQARLILGAVSTPRRARLELQFLKLKTEEIASDVPVMGVRNASTQGGTGYPAKKRKRRSTSSPVQAASPIIPDSASETEEGTAIPEKAMSQLSFSNVFPGPVSSLAHQDDRIKVVKLDWLRESIKQGKIEPLHRYLLYEGRPLPASAEETHSQSLRTAQSTLNPSSAWENSSTAPSKSQTFLRTRRNAALIMREQVKDAARRDFHGRTFASSTQKTRTAAGPALLRHESTPEYEEATAAALPEMPQWVKENKIYACQRSTPLHTPNDDFIGQLRKIKLARVLTNDEVGVRAYSTAIASLAAYPHPLTSVGEVLALPGCDQKIATFFHEWKTSENHRIQAVDDMDADPALKALQLFYNIWGVGATTARQFYYDEDKKWRDLDDVIEYGWDSLTRVQQIGVKYYDEFERKIPRAEVEYIASVVTYHAKQVVDDGIECIIVGGHRRGKLESGDVDLIVSHRDESATSHLIEPLATALERAGWITHVLMLRDTNSTREQQPIALDRGRAKGVGFDTLDKALVVWQDPHWPDRDATLAADPAAKNPNPHRRVDIILSPWRTVGCAVAGWSAGTTFQRDMRRYAKHARRWKFDSSGVRDRATGAWLDLERWRDAKTRAPTWQEAERRVFDGLGLPFREPWERCTD